MSWTETKTKFWINEKGLNIEKNVFSYVGSKIWNNSFDETFETEQKVGELWLLGSLACHIQMVNMCGI